MKKIVFPQQFVSATYLWATMGSILLFAAFSIEEKPSPAFIPSHGATFVVNIPGNLPDADLNDNICNVGGDTGGCTLRAAIEQANATPGADMITFSLGGGIPILGTGDLPEVTETVTIDGATGGATQVQLSGLVFGVPAGSGDTGLVFTDDNNIVRNLIIVGYSSPGIILRNGEGSLIENTWLGLDQTGVGLPNFEGLLIDNSSNNTIGGAEASKRNIISGNLRSGILIQGAQATMNKVLGNYIGTDASGNGVPNKRMGSTAANAGDGILIDNAPGNIIGGTEPGMGNVISGNGDAVFSGNGIKIQGPEATQNTVQGNYIGTNMDGDAALGNAGSGIFVDNAPNNTIGGTEEGAGNLISSNTGQGLFIAGPEATMNTVQGNHIGTNKDGDAALGNLFSGVVISGAPNNTIGGTEEGAGNLISDNTNGIVFTGTEATMNRVEGNYIGTNKDGNAPLGNKKIGVLIEDASENTIGGTVEGARNIISGNREQGLVISGAQSTLNQVAGNYIGTNKEGNGRLENYGSGIMIDNAPNNTIGGTAAEARNIISGNYFDELNDPPDQGNGIFITGVQATMNTVQGNHIGTNKDGDAPLGNDGSGILIDNAPANHIGGTEPGMRNLISGNGNAVSNVANGITIRGAEATMNKVEGNYIGTDRDGLVKIANYHSGVWIENAPNNMIGGTTAEARNIISGNFFEGETNQGNGVTIMGVQATMNQVLGNYIGTNKDGTAALGNGESGVLINNAFNNTIGGVEEGARNIISGNVKHGIVISGTLSTVNQVFGNYIGVSKDGNVALQNEGSGVVIENASNNTIGGATATQRNIISGNAADGIIIQGAQAAINIIEGNYIGTTATGTGMLGNGSHGVFISEAPLNRIGGSGALNIISGNEQHGVYIIGANENIVGGNHIGTDVNGMAAFPNGGNGVLLIDASNTLVGYDDVGQQGERNLISGNEQDGIKIEPLFAVPAGNLIADNFIGTTGDGEAALGNSRHGIFIESATTTVVKENVVSSNAGTGVVISNGAEHIIYNNRIGIAKFSNMPLGNQQHGVALVNPDPSSPTTNNTVEKNTIAYNNADGVSIIDMTSVRNVIRENSITSNGGLGINLRADGVTDNDNGDSDTGPNTLQNFPILTAASGNDLTIEGALNSTPNTPVRIEFFANNSCDPTGHGEGQVFIGNRDVTTDNSGDANISATLAGVSVPNGYFITATATSADEQTTNGVGNTSEFSPCVPITGATGCSLVVTNTNNDGAGSLRDAILCANVTPNIGQPDSITFDIPQTGVPLIAPTSALPTVIDPVIIDATTQPDANMVRVDGNDAGNDAHGLHITEGESTVKGLALTRFAGHGILLETEGENTITQSYLGTDASQTPNLGNLGDGIHIRGGSNANIIGGTEAEAGNVIYGNAGAGVAVANDAIGNTIRGNHIAANGGPGIDLAADGISANDSGDSDTGANMLQNFPVLTAAQTGSLHVEGTLESTPDMVFDLDFYVSAACGSAAERVGETYVGTETFTTDAQGQAVFAVTFADVIFTEGFVSATATDPAGNTSELSACLQIDTNVAVDAPDRPTTARLLASYPNPFATEATIAFELSHAEHVTVRVFNTLGQEVAELVDGVRTAGRHAVTWQAAGMPSGLYYYQLEAADFHAVRQMVRVK